MTERKEKENKLIAMVTTGGVQVILLFLAFFLISWHEPDPPLSSLSGANGIELNFGMDTEGSGDVQPTEPVGKEQLQPEKSEERKPEDAKPKEAEEVVEKIRDAKVEDTKAVEKIVTREDDESPVGVNEKKKEETKPVEKPKEKVVEVKPKEEVRKEDTKAVYKPGNASKTDNAGEGKEGKPGNQGDDVGKTGDKGNPEGTPDAKAMYGNPGSGGNGAGGNGTGLDLYGWSWDNIPNPNVPDNETGRIVFLIEVDEDGNLQGYQKASSSVSIATERACIAAIEKLTFTKKSGAKVPPVSKGKITFVIRAK